MEIVKKTDDPLYMALMSENTVKVILDTADPNNKVVIYKIGSSSFRVVGMSGEREGKRGTQISGADAVRRTMETARDSFYGSVE